jgi:hypothetical protein
MAFGDDAVQSTLRYLWPGSPPSEAYRFNSNTCWVSYSNECGVPHSNVAFCVTLGWARHTLPDGSLLRARSSRKQSLRRLGLIFITSLLLLALAACSKPPQTEPTDTLSPTGLESIPAPDPSKYPNFSDLTGWKNPYFVVRDDGIGFVDLSNREIHILKPEEIPAELAALPESAWPYGRVVLVSQAAPKDATEQTKADLRKNRALLLGTLKELDVQFRAAP